ncbi:hypothetical protein CA13_11730 [Planctomycetes bacterium CA13]|uniref:Uncharacterized protein n=1 Tax=Novipirellula herctigrandis TaxID=2527986 RepID=A0A5C5YYL0_9BACT|nr:hypothetical protein CA13_11730 [Planctomycetes bacterium CA13]
MVAPKAVQSRGKNHSGRRIDLSYTQLERSQRDLIGWMRSLHRVKRGEIVAIASTAREREKEYDKRHSIGVKPPWLKTQSAPRRNGRSKHRASSIERST